MSHEPACSRRCASPIMGQIVSLPRAFSSYLNRRVDACPTGVLAAPEALSKVLKTDLAEKIHQYIH